MGSPKTMHVSPAGQSCRKRSQLPVMLVTSSLHSEGPVELDDIAVLLAAWGVASALGNSRIGPAKSAVIMMPQLLWTFALFILGMLPLMVPHYGFAILAILGPKSLLWPVLIVDSLLVGWLTALLVALAYFAVRRATDSAGVQLAGTAAATAPAGS